MFFHKFILFIFQDIKLMKRIILNIFIFINLLMLIAIFPVSSSVLVTWHSTKDFILLFRYEFFHIILFLILIGAFSNSNYWVLVRRFRTRDQIAFYKILSIFILSIFFTFLIIIPGSVLSLIVKHLIFSENYTALFLYVPMGSSDSSIIYFIYVYFSIAMIIGLMFTLLQMYFQNGIISTVILIVLACADHYTYAIIPRVFVLSEHYYPISAFLIIVAIIILLINLIFLKINNISYYTEDGNA